MLLQKTEETLLLLWKEIIKNMFDMYAKFVHISENDRKEIFRIY